MIDSVILAVSLHLSQPVPGLVQQITAASVPPTPQTGERHVRRFERWVDQWADRAQEQVARLGAAYAKGPVEPHHLSQLDNAIALLDLGTSESATLFRRQEAVTGRFLKRLLDRDPDHAAAFALERERLLKAWSRAALLRVDLILALRAIRALHRPDAGSGPVFDNAEDLADYLRTVAA